MCWLKRNLWKTGIPIAGMLLLLVLMAWIPVSAADAHEMTSGLTAPETAQATPTEDATVTALNKEKLAQDISQQQHTWENWVWSNAATILSSFLSTLVIVLGALFGFWRWRSDRRDAQDKELKDRHNEREKRAEERFQSAVTGLGDEKEGTRIGAAILLRTFLRPGYEQFYTQTFDLAVANLRLPRTPEVPADPNTPLPLTTLSQALIGVFKEAFPLVRDMLREQNVQLRPVSLDARGIQLDRAYLREADLKQAWMPLASLKNADLRKADLREAYLSQANLRADLRGADLRGAFLREVDLRNAHLTMADLREADLTAADFNQANLSQANLSQATFNGVDPGRILRPSNIENAVSLEGTDLRGVKGLTKEQLEICKAKGAIVDEDPTTPSSQLTVLPLPSSQNNDAQAPLAPSAQESRPTPDTGDSSALSSKLNPES